MIIDPIISKNVALIKDANGKDIERIYDKYGNLVFKNWNTLEGPFPIECFTSSNKLRNYRIYGNTIQDGTPTPENPVEVHGCGERTENLFDKDTAVVYSAWIQRNGGWSYASDSRSIRIRVKPNTQYTLSTEGRYTIFRILEMQSDVVPTEQNKWPAVESRPIVYAENESHCTFETSENAKYIVFQSNLSVVNKWLSELMLVEGDSIRSDYIPYGYKIPVTVSGENLATLIQGSYDPNGKPNTKLNRVKTQLIPVEYGDVFVMTLNKWYFRNVAFFDESKTFIKFGNDLSIIPYIYADVQNAKYISVILGDMDTGTGNNISPNYSLFRLEYRPITTPVYIGSEPLHKIGDYADYIDFKRGVVVRQIKKSVLTGDEAWIENVHNANQDVYKIENFANFRLFSSSAGNAGIFRCNQILYMRPPYPSGLYDRIVLLHGNGYPHALYFSTKKSMGIDTVDKFKSFLAEQYELGQPVTIWYVLAEPEEEVLPLSQKIPTNISSNTFSCTISPEPSKVMIQYKKK